MQFSVNHPILFVIAGIIIAAVLAQSAYFFIKSYRRAKVIGMDMKKVKKSIVSSAIFTIAPAVSIVITILALSKSLGIALPWLRLSVVGSLSYEAIAAANAAKAPNSFSLRGALERLFFVCFFIFILQGHQSGIRHRGG